MKPRLMPTFLPFVATGLIAITAGCEDESKKAAAAAAAPVLMTNAPSEPTNVAAEPLPAVPKIVTVPKLSPGVDEIVQLAQAGVGEEVLLAYIENSSTAYKLDVDQVLYLHDVGLSAEVIAAMVRHGQTVPEESATAATAASTPVETSASVGESALATVPAVTEPVAEYVDAAAPVDGTEAPQQVTYNYFYNALSPYGTWLEVPDYGWCWQPTVAVINTGWRPYCDRGRWVYTDSGWYWQSDYSWGWAPFHYGRWYRSPAFGWVWAPDTVWGPAWVTWRYSSAYCGWAPLPPGCYYDAGFGFRFRGGHVGINFDFGLGYDCFTFVPLRYVCHRTPWVHCLPSHRIRAVINNTTIVNNYVTGPGNNTIVNVGPGTATIAAASRQEVRKVALRDIDARPGTLIKADRLDRDGATLAVFRPKLPKQASTPPPQITQRQQEVRRKTEQLAKLEPIRRGGATSSDRSTLISPRSRTAASATSPDARPKSSGNLSDRRSSGNERPQSPSIVKPRGIGDSPSRPLLPRSSVRDSNPVRPGGDRGTRSGSTQAKPLEPPRRATPNPGTQPRSIEPRAPSRNERLAPAPQQPASPGRSEPSRRSATQSPAYGQPSFSRPAPSYSNPQRTPSYRPETRRSDPARPSFTPTPPRSQGLSQPAPRVIQPQPAPRSSPPAYQQPRSISPPSFRSEPSRAQPSPPSRPQSAPSYRPAPAPSRPSAPSRSQPAPSSSPSRSEGNRRER